MSNSSMQNPNPYGQVPNQMIGAPGKVIPPPGQLAFGSGEMQPAPALTGNGPGAPMYGAIPPAPAMSGNGPPPQGNGPMPPAQGNGPPPMSVDPYRGPSAPVPGLLGAGNANIQARQNAARAWMAARGGRGAG
jgi:hypothetical protein